MTWTHRTASFGVQKYLKRVRTKVNTLKFTPNLTPKQLKALNELSSDQTMVIKSAEKGSGMVVEDPGQYIKDGLDQLADKTILLIPQPRTTLPLKQNPHHVHNNFTS